ncbi:DUF1758 domain-containing protein [Trichonephila clavipes]|uniref:DUF1758 domain-containing protein n=1 Tax=Trichonephila clavipes TaxID=2585209 RepID=A0A8X6UYT0_TRICX|nr:DUF1758 domain-containing protein [Trichonephila clavipes]
MNREKNIDIQISKIYEKAERLFKADQEIKEIINFSDEEYDTMESYRNRFTEIRVIYEKNYNKHDESKSEISSEIAPDNLKLPKLNLKEYDLMPKSWIAFWGQFCRVHEDKNLREEDKFQYLHSSLKPRTKARDIAEKTLGVTTSNYAAILYPVVETYLLVEILKAWDRYRLKRELKEEDPVLTKEKVLENLMSFLLHEVEGEEHRALAETAFESGIKRKLRSVTKRLLKENICEVYDDILRQWQKEGIIEAILKTEVSKPGHYLPHRPVIKSSSATTEVRRFFDASFKRPGYASLNECLSVGPSLSEHIPPLLLRFRTVSIGVIADIKQAFLQLAVKPEDRDYLRFLWWNTEDKSKLEFFRHCRVVCGVTSSPFLLNASIRHHLNSAEFQLESLQQTIEKLKKGFYVDNLTIRVENQEKLVKFKTQTLEIMMAATFKLRCWAHTGVQDQESQNVLGLKWGTETDEL